MAGNNGRKNTRPAYTHYPMDFWSSPVVQCMAPTEKLLFLRLLDECWVSDGLPKDPKALRWTAKSVGVELEEFLECWERILRGCFTEERNGRLWNSRLLRELGVAEEYSKGQAESGAKGGRKSGETRRKQAEAKRKQDEAKRSDPSISEAKRSEGKLPSHPVPSLPIPSRPKNPGDSLRESPAPATQGLQDKEPKKAKRTAKGELAKVSALLRKEFPGGQAEKLIEAMDGFRQGKKLIPATRWTKQLKKFMVDGELDIARATEAYAHSDAMNYTGVFEPDKTNKSQTAKDDAMMRGIELGMNPNYGTQP